MISKINVNITNLLSFLINIYRACYLNNFYKLIVLPSCVAYPIMMSMVKNFLWQIYERL